MSTPVKFRLIMISAMYENGGNTRSGIWMPSALFVYPFESSRHVYGSDFLTVCFPEIPLAEFGISGSSTGIMRRLSMRNSKFGHTPHVSKFRDLRNWAAPMRP